jgi:hypothetical protein
MATKKKLTEDQKIVELNQQFDSTLELFQERITQLELALEDFNFYRILGESQFEFSRQGLRMISQMGRILFLKNPLIKRGVQITAYYVFGQGITISSPDEAVDAVIQSFLDDVKNRAELTRQEALTGKEHELEVQGNLFFAFFTNRSTGRVLVRTISLEQILDIVTNPEDRKDPWYYHRQWQEITLNETTGQEETVTKEAYYPDWLHNPTTKPDKIGSFPVMWDTPIYHKKVGALPDMKFGLCEFYAAQDWAKAYTDFLQAWAQITQALARFAWKRKTVGGAKAIQAEKTKLSTTISLSSIETNPPPVAGSTAIIGDGTDLEPIRTSGATTSMEDGRRLLLMSAAVFGLPETFFGDISKGNHATASTLDRPTELKFRDRQTFWKDTLTDIISFILLQAAKATSGKLNGKVIVQTEDDGSERVFLPDGTPPQIKVEFPPILEHSVKDQIDAIVEAATLNSPGTMAGTLDMVTVVGLICDALQIENRQAVLDALQDTSLPDTGGVAEAAREVAAAVRQLKEVYGRAA